MFLYTSSPWIPERSLVFPRDKLTQSAGYQSQPSIGSGHVT